MFAVRCNQSYIVNVYYRTFQIIFFDYFISILQTTSAVDNQPTLQTANSGNKNQSTAHLSITELYYQQIIKATFNYDFYQKQFLQTLQQTNKTSTNRLSTDQIKLLERVQHPHPHHRHHHPLLQVSYEMFLYPMNGFQYQLCYYQ